MAKTELFVNKQSGGLHVVNNEAKTTGNLFWVDSEHPNALDAATRGGNPSFPFATLDFAISDSRITANNGDKIFVMPGHAETLAAAITVDVAGLSIIGMGEGTARPTFTGNGVIDNMTITAANVVIENLYFNESTAAATANINVGAANCQIRNCHFDLGTNDVECITVEDAGDDLLVEGNTFIVTADGPDTAVEIEAAGVTRTTIKGNIFVCSDGTNAFDAAAINSTAANTVLVVTGNTFLGGGVAATAVIAATAVGKSILSNFYGGGAVNVDADQFSGDVTITAEPAPLVVDDKVWYVDSADGAVTNDGHTPQTALITIAAAEALAAAGDTIVVAGGHSETLAAKLVVNLVGLSIIGSGTGTRRPQLTGNVADDTISLAAAGIQIVNIQFNEATSVSGGAIDVAAANCVIDNCVFDLGTNDAEAITVPNAGDRCTIRNCTFNVTADGPSAAIEVEDATQDRLIVTGCTFICSDGTNAFDTAAINSTVANTNMVVSGNTFLGAGIASAAVIAATAIDKTIAGNTYGAGAIDLDTDRLQGGTHVEGTSPFGTTWYVAASGGNAAFSGKSPQAPFALIATAIAAASAGDTVILGPGTHSVDVSDSALIPLDNMHFKAAIPPCGGKPSTIITHDADDGADIVLLDADGVVFEGIEFLMVAGGTTALHLVTVAQTDPVNGLVFKDCWFNLNSVDALVVGINCDDATNDTIGMAVINCRFTGGDATAQIAKYIEIGVGGATRMLVERCMFECEAANATCQAIGFGDPGGSGGSYALTIRDNDFIGPPDYGEDGVVIVFDGGMTEGEILGTIRTNYFAATSLTPITQNEFANSGIVENYVGDTADGGTKVDPGA